MSYAVCTLFEGDYHLGTGALTNSLYKRGFRGSVYAGYRGELPAWTNNLTQIPSVEWEGSTSFHVGEDCKIHFLPLTTSYHFANYKPRFMIDLFDKVPGLHGLFYFDPDIVVRCKWEFFEYWSSFGVAVVHEIVSNDMPATHPIRKGWENLIKNSNRQITSNIHSYINCGFCGLTKNNIEFLKVWSEFIEFASANHAVDLCKLEGHSKTNLFYTADQDAFNIAAMCSGCPVSELGPEGMDFTGGGWTMSHATFSPKPWNKNFLVSLLQGNPPNLAERFYWRNVLHPIALYKRRKVLAKVYFIMVATFIGRFYKRYS